MGIRNAPFCFQSLLSAILSRFTFRFALVYMDDILVYSSMIEDHFSNLESVFQLLRDPNIKLKRSKCTFGVDQIQYFGFTINQSGISPSPDKVSTIKSFPPPKTKTNVHSFVGMAQFLRKFIQNFSHIARPHFQIMSPSTPFLWTPECQTAFDTLKC